MEQTPQEPAEPEASVFRDILNKRIFERILDLSDTEAKKLLESLKPSPRLRIPNDFILERETVASHYSYDVFEAKYKLERETKKITEKVVPIDPVRWLELSTSNVLTLHKPGKRRRLKNVKDFLYLGKDQLLVLRTNESTELYSTDFVLSSISLPGGIDISFPFACSEKYLAFRDPSQNLLSVFTRDFELVSIPFSEILVHTFLENFILFISPNEGGGMDLEIYDLESDSPAAESQGLEDDVYSLCALDSERFTVCGRDSRRLVIWRLLGGVIQEEQVIQDECGVARFANDLFMTDKAFLFRSLFEEETNFIQTSRFGDTYSIQRRFPSRKSVKDVSKALQLPINQDITEIIVGFCVERV